MNNNLLIIGAGVYGLVAKEIAEAMTCFEKIDFVDDNAKITPNGIETVGTTNDLKHLSSNYGKFIVAIGNPDVRLKLIERIESETSLRLVSLVSPSAYVSPSARVEKGCIIEPMAVVHTLSILEKGCIISAGAVVNHASVCRNGVHVDCNATVAGYVTVPKKTKVQSGSVYTE